MEIRRQKASSTLSTLMSFAFFFRLGYYIYTSQALPQPACRPSIDITFADVKFYQAFGSLATASMQEKVQS